MNRLYIFLAKMLPKNEAIKWCFIFPPHLTSAKNAKIAFISQMPYYCTGRLQPIAGLIYSVFLFATHTVAAVRLHKSSIKGQLHQRRSNRQSTELGLFLANS